MTNLKNIIKSNWLFISIIFILTAIVITLSILLVKKIHSKPDVNFFDKISYKYYDVITDGSHDLDVDKLHRYLLDNDNYIRYMDIFSKYDEYADYKIKNLYNNSKFDYVISVLKYIFFKNDDEYNAYGCKYPIDGSPAYDCKYFVDLIKYVKR